jgi:pimeloyl-ACP methyl ester carboxylesterase
VTPTPGSVQSQDGTTIGYLRVGEGPPLVMVHGSLGVAEAWLAVANLLADSFTCYLMDRRGRGRSGDASEYSIEREYQDVAAVLAAAGAKPHLIGHSYGAVCALGADLEAPVDKLILYEPPAGVLFGPEVEDYRQAIAAGDPEKALEIGITKIVGVSREQFELMRANPMFPVFKALAPGWVREIQQIEKLGTSLERYRTIESPVLMLLGTDTSESLKNSTAALLRVLKNARVSALPGEGHGALRTAPELVAQRVREFLS